MNKNFSHEDKLSYSQKAILRTFNKYGFQNSILENKPVDTLKNPIPWYTYPSIEYISQFDFSKKEIFEFGSGTSTFWWAKRSKSVTSVEHNNDWFESIKEKIPENANIILRELSEEYSNSILEFDKNFDVVIIDGAFRECCVKNAIKKVSKNGMIILDNSERVCEFENYKYIVNTLSENNFIQIDFKGFGALKEYTWCTSLFLKREFDFRTLNITPTIPIGGFLEKNK